MQSNPAKYRPEIGTAFAHQRLNGAAPCTCITSNGKLARRGTKHEGEYSMTDALNGCKVAVPAMDGFEQAELVEPKRALADAGATVHVISAARQNPELQKHRQGRCGRGRHELRSGEPRRLRRARAAGRRRQWRCDSSAASRAGFRAGRQQREEADRGDLPRHGAAGVGGNHRGPHGDELAQLAGRHPQRGRRVGRWVDQEVAEDGNPISSRKPDDVPAFNSTLIARLGKRKAA